METPEAGTSDTSWSTLIILKLMDSIHDNFPTQLFTLLINTEVSFWHLSTQLTTDDCSSAITPTVTTIVTTASLYYFRLY